MNDTFCRNCEHEISFFRGRWIDNGELPTICPAGDQVAHVPYLGVPDLQDPEAVEAWLAAP